MASKGLKDNGELIVLALFLLSSAVYFSTTPGIVSCNAGSHLALIRAVADNHTFIANSFAYYTGGIDYALYKNNIYSDRAPGLAFAAIPFYAVGKAASSAFTLASYYRGYDAGDPAAFTALLLPILAGGACVALAYLICRELGAGTYASLVVAFTLASGTLLWKYSATLFSHSLSCFLLMLSVYLAITLKELPKQRIHACILFFALGYLVLTEYANILLTVIILAYLLFTKRFTIKQMASMKPDALIPLLCLAIPILSIPAYNYYIFGDPWKMSYAYSPHHPWVSNLGESLTTPLSEGLTGLILTGRGIHGGLLFTTPIFILAIWGLYYLSRERKNEATLLAALFLAHLLFYAKYKTWNGGGTTDTRYLVTVMPMLLIPLSAWIEGFLAKRRLQTEKTIYEGLMWILVAVSVLNVAYDVGTFEGHGSRDIRFPILTYDNLAINFNNLFPNAGKLPVYAGIACLMYAITSLILRRTPGLEQEKAKYNMTVAVCVFVGALLIFVFSGFPKQGYTLQAFEYSQDGFIWSSDAPPYSSDAQTMMVRGHVNVQSPGSSVILNVLAEDCVKEIYVNDAHIGSVENCTPCLHCNGAKLDLTRLLESGENKVAFKIEGLGNITRFNVLS